ncbi:MAG: FAD-dependent oxidoreductase [Bradymonadia bacterium]
MSLRSTNLDKLPTTIFDTLIVGAGINGAVSAAALSSQGASVALIDRGDFGSFTSQNSSNLAWGGIKYMDTLEFGLVLKLCKSRNQLMTAYPSSVKEIRFLTSIGKGFKYPSLLLYFAALLYWFLGRCFTHPPRWIRGSRLEKEESIINGDLMSGGFEYSDAILVDNDSRFVFGFVRQAITNGCIAANYVESLGASRAEGGLWHVECRDVRSGEIFTIKCRTLVNACGPFVDEHNDRANISTDHAHVFSKGIHLIVDGLAKVNRVLTFFADDGRPFFAIPMGTRTSIGTTDTRVPTPESEITAEDEAFVLDNINKRLRCNPPLSAKDVIATRCGVRPLVVNDQTASTSGDWTKLSRKHEVEINFTERTISIFGGKLTDCINVGDEVASAVGALGVDMRFSGTKWYGEPLHAREEFIHQARLLGLDELTSPHASEPLSERLWRRYGMRALGMLEDIRQDPSMSDSLIEGSEYLRCEIFGTARHEMVVTLDDFLRRRSRLSQVMSHTTLMQSKGLRQACRILFGSDAPAQWSAYFNAPWPDDDNESTSPSVVSIKR